MTQDCCGLRPQQIVAASGGKIPYALKEIVTKFIKDAQGAFQCELIIILASAPNRIYKSLLNYILGKKDILLPTLALHHNKA